MPSTEPNSQFRLTASTLNQPSDLDSFNTARYLFPNQEERSTIKDEDRIPTPDIRTYLKMTDPDDKFPTLSRRDGSGLVGDPYCSTSS